MNIKKQKELINLFLSEISDGVRPLYQEIITYLSELGYNPQKTKSYMSFKHDLHTKQMAKIGIKDREQMPFLALRFSACQGYSKKFADVIGAFIVKYPARAACCIDGGCRFCAGEPETHVYTYTFPDGISKSHCGAYALEIPDISADDIAEIKKLIKEEHKYLLKHQAGVED